VPTSDHREPTSFIARRRFILVFAAGLLFLLPALRIGFIADDYYQRAALEGWLPMRAEPRSLYQFTPNDPAENAQFIARGFWPWWTTPELKLVFFRPLSSALIALDHTLFGRNPLPAHLHALFWLAAFLAGAAALFRRTLPGSLGLFAFVLFAVDDTHAMAAAWIAARHATVSGAFALAALWGHLGWRQSGWRPGALLGPLGFAVALAGGESAIGFLGYFVAFELLAMRTATLRSRLIACAPYAALLAGHAVLSGMAGAGVAGSGGYLDPRAEPLTFLAALPGRLAVLVANSVFGLPADALLFRAELKPLFVAAGLGATVILVLAGRRALRSVPQPEATSLKWLTLGATLALVPAAAALPGERVLMPASVGAAALLAAIVRSAWAAVRGPRLLRTKAAAVGILVAVALPNLVLAPLLRLAKTVGFTDMSLVAEEISSGLDLGERPVDAVVLHSADLLVSYVPVIRAFHSGLSPAELGAALAALRAGASNAGADALKLRSWRVLSMAAAKHELIRTDPRSFELTTPEGTLLDGGWPRLYRPASHPLPAGTVFRQEGLVITVLADRDGAPMRVRFTFDRDLDDPGLRFLSWRDRGFRHFRMPPVGARVAVDLGPPFFPRSR
jgi:hypothetical protein